MNEMQFGDNHYEACGGSLFDVVRDPSTPDDEPIYKHFLQCRFPHRITDMIQDEDYLYLVFGEENA